MCLMLRYHIPCTWIHRGENLLVLHEELGGDPSLVSLLTRAGQDICSSVSELILGNQTLPLARRNVQSLYPRLILATHALECRKALQSKLIISNFQCIAAISIPELW
ncbi:hypothetical protein Q3G72_001243 [Acer saccharum]|nr:hypothetical protein Q3G72_001243 [Acer saccharum]